LLPIQLQRLNDIQDGGRHLGFGVGQMGEEIFNRRMILAMGVVANRIRCLIAKAASGIRRQVGCKPAHKTLIELYSCQGRIKIAAFIEQTRQKLLGEAVQILMKDKTHFAPDQLLAGRFTGSVFRPLIFRKPLHACFYLKSICIGISTTRWNMAFFAAIHVENPHGMME
jgi:hypothetical protein